MTTEFHAPRAARRGRGAVGSLLATTLVVSGVGLALAPAAAHADADTTAPVLAEATLSPIHPIPAHVRPTGTTWAPSTTTGNNNWFVNDTVTVHLSAMDDVAATLFRVQIGSGPITDIPANVVGSQGTAEYVLTGDQNSTVRYWAVDAAGNQSAARTVPVRIDTKRPVAAWPGVIDGKIARSATFASVKPVLSDPVPGSGGAATRDMWIDGERVYLVPFDPATLSVGAHTWAIAVGDFAGNQAKYTLTFEITTSYADILAVVERLAAAGTISEDVRNRLVSAVEAAQAAEASGPQRSADKALKDLGKAISKDLPEGPIRTALEGDVERLRSNLAGVPAPEVATGIDVEAMEQNPRMPQVYAGPPVVNEDPDFKVLVFANRQGGFRHQHIPHTQLFIQDLGREHNFDVDLFDYMAPSESVKFNPFASIEALSQYDTIIAVSSVGRSTFSTARPSDTDPSVTVNEQAVLQEYIRGGGGFVAIHGATDSMQDWPWYEELVGGIFDGHGSAVNGIQHNCEACRHVEVVTEDRTHPGTAHFEKKIRVLDELYNWRKAPRERVHVLQTITESTFVGGLNAGDGRIEGADHPIAWCQNFDGGRSFTQGLMHDWNLSLDPRFQQMILGGILWTAGQAEGNCVSHDEVFALLDGEAGSGGLAADAAVALRAHLDASYAAYVEQDYKASLKAISDARTLANRPSTGGAESRGLVLAKLAELDEWQRMLWSEAKAR